MRRLREFGVGLPLYGVLLVLPALLLMVLQGYGLYKAYQSENAALPLRAENNRYRLARGLHERFTSFVDSEEARPYFEYAEVWAPSASSLDEFVLLATPLAAQPAGSQLEAWFQADLAPDAPDDDLELIPNGARGRSEGRGEEDLFRALEDLVDLERARFQTLGTAQNPAVDTFEIPLITAATHADHAEHPECLRACLPILENRSLTVRMTRFRLVLFEDTAGFLRLVALRNVAPLSEVGGMAGGRPRLPKAGRCLDALQDGFDFVQGFFIDPRWVFDDLPTEIALLTLDPGTQLVSGPQAGRSTAEGALELTFNLATLLDIERVDSAFEPRMQLAVLADAAAPWQRFRDSILRFGAVAVMLILSLGTGLYFMTTNVRQKLEQARRTQNFVAAVTHELRTPLASIRLHGEMLQDGIPQSPEARNEYYERILGETERLSVLVENVLQKSRLDGGGSAVQAADLSDVVRRLESQLRGHGAHHALVAGSADMDLGRAKGHPDDLAFELAGDLPEVRLNVDGLNSILRNLIGNARKYASGTGEPAEPVIVRTSREGDQVLLEVLDRGPGVPPDEARQIFEAFYRMGDEATREKPGTGLGLHLVELHAAAMGARAGYRPRPGGGAAFVIAFEPA